LNYCSSSSYFLAFLRLYVFKYLSYGIYTWSGINEVLINYDRYLVLSNKKNLFNKKHSFKIITLINFFLSFLLFVPNLVAYQISLDSNQRDFNYFVSKTDFGTSYLFEFYTIVIFTVLDVFLPVFLILTSVQLALTGRNFSRNIIRLQNNNHNQTANTRQDIKRKKLEMNIFKLVLTMSIIFTLVRLNDFTYSLYDCLFLLNIVSDYEFLVYYTNLWYALLVLSLNTNIFILLGFNKKFRSIFFHYTRNTFATTTTAAN
jgi:hypothetical protein